MKNFRSRQQGFTLIELMTVVVVIAILASIAYPSYTQYVMRAHRAEAKTNLLEVAQWMERVATATGLYPTPDNQQAALDALENQLTDQYYTIAIRSDDGSAFTVSAIPRNSQTGDVCGTLTLTNTGARGATPPRGSTMTAAQCWNR